MKQRVQAGRKVFEHDCLVDQYGREKIKMGRRVFMRKALLERGKGGFLLEMECFGEKNGELRREAQSTLALGSGGHH